MTANRYENLDQGIDCPRCGAITHAASAVCPECGLNFYDPPLEEQPWAEPEAPPADLHPVLAALFGGLIAGMLSFLVHYLVRSLAAPGPLSPVGRVMLLFAGPLGAFVGAYLALMIGRSRPTAVGLAVGALNAASATVLLAVWVDLASLPWWQLELLPTWGLTLLGGLFGALAYVRREQRQSLRDFFSPPAGETALYQDLLRKVNGDRAAVERLVTFERRFAPEAGRADLLRAAIRRWERDNR